jgi:hypothetical protein
VCYFKITGLLRPCCEDRLSLTLGARWTRLLCQGMGTLGGEVGSWGVRVQVLCRRGGGLKVGPVSGMVWAMEERLCLAVEALEAVREESATAHSQSE